MVMRMHCRVNATALSTRVPSLCLCDVYFRFDVLEAGDDGEGHDDHQRPRAPLADVHRGPRPQLIGIAPDPEERAEVFGQPDEESDEQERDQQRHRPVAFAEEPVSPEHLEETGPFCLCDHPADDRRHRRLSLPDDAPGVLYQPP